MWLRFGWDERWDDAFASEPEHAEAWARNRERLMAACPHGRRPAAWWQFKSPIPYPRDDEYAPAALFEAELLTDSETAELVAEWREQFETAQAAGFWFCLGPGRFLKGQPAKRAHYRWAGIPVKLVKRWSLEYRRRHRTVRALAASVPVGIAVT